MAEGPRWIGVEPSVWFLVFHERSCRAWLNRRWVGRFKHVSAYGYLPDSRVWVFYDVMLGRTRVAVLPDGPTAEAAVRDLEAEAVTLVMKPRGDRRHRLRWGFYCVPAMAHLVGLETAAVRPDGLFRACLAAGADLADWSGAGCVGGLDEQAEPERV